jgi:hypothetical protein
MSKKPDKTLGQELKVRCPLCVEENVTVPASKVEFTDNGVKSKFNANAGKTKRPNKKTISTEQDDTSMKEMKADPSVLKWGGRHATQKKLSRKMKQTQCRIGSKQMRAKRLFLFSPRTKESQLN